MSGRYEKLDSFPMNFRPDPQPGIKHLFIVLWSDYIMQIRTDLNHNIV